MMPLDALPAYRADFRDRLASLDDADLRSLCVTLRRRLSGPALRDPADVQAWGYAVAMEAAEARGVTVPARRI